MLTAGPSPTTTEIEPIASESGEPTVAVDRVAAGTTWAALDLDDRRRIVRSSLLAAAAGFVPFLLLLWDLGLRPLRTAGTHGFASNFYDIQARALMRGHLSIPTDSIGIEGFVVGGRTFMYFPPFPALLRIPALLFTDAVDGRLTAPSMLLAWIALAAATATLVWSVRLLACGAAPVTRVEAALGGVVITTATGGSVVVYLASRPWAYHEVYMWATAFAVGTLAALTALARRATPKLAAVTVGCALGAMLTRATSGWAMALAVILFGVVMGMSADRRRIVATLIGGGAAVLLIGSAINWAKFRHPYMFPLRDQVFTELNEHRQRALEENGGSITGPQFFLSSLVNYFKPDGIRLVAHFPFVTLPADPARAYGGAFLDQTYRTGSVPLFMPALFLGALWGGVVAFRRRASAWVRGVRIPMLGALAVSGGVMFYGYIAHRYSSDFLPVLIIGSAVAATDLAGRLAGRPRRFKVAAVSTMAVVAAFGATANAAAGLTAARIERRGAALEQYLSWQLAIGRLAGNADRLVAVSGALPADGPADRLQIVGFCDALYLATGDQYEPWVIVQARELRVDATASDSGFFGGLLPLIEVDGLTVRTLQLESDFDGRVRLRIAEGYFYYPTEWVELAPGETIEVAVSLDSPRTRYVISLDGNVVGRIPASESDGVSPFTTAQPRLAMASPFEQALVGLTLSADQGPVPELCARILGEVGE